MRAVLSAFLISTLPGGAFACDQDTVTIRGEFGQVNFDVELAQTPQEQARGLMFREEMDLFDGMLFVYPSTRQPSFWMKNTLISLDMIFVDETGQILMVHPEAVPGDTTPIPGPEGTIAVLEINGGVAERLGIAEGDVLGHPVLDPEIAALSCD
ncbi:DUF192 domain-containing protein [Aestuariibius insulae]|uniref:DUF192 domain-containing protein n=1 Tax=Aestuariibius insulae TaxID=2058287 RepID=UPI00345E6DC6